VQVGLEFYGAIDFNLAWGLDLLQPVAKQPALGRASDAVLANMGLVETTDILALVGYNMNACLYKHALDCKLTVGIRLSKLQVAAEGFIDKSVPLLPSFLFDLLAIEVPLMIACFACNAKPGYYCPPGTADSAARVVGVWGCCVLSCAGARALMLIRC
jgi:hypothetical protein